MFELSVQDERGFNQGFAPVGSNVLRMRRRNDWIVHRIEAIGARRVLELGCGTGETAAYLAAHSAAEIVGVDISAQFIDHARQRNVATNLRYECADLLDAAQWPLDRFDLVCGNGILHHLVVRLPAVLASLRRVTRPGGGLAFIEPNLLNPYCAFIFGTRVGRRLARLEPDEMAFRPGPLRTALRTAGWTDVSVATRDFLVPGLPAAAVNPLLAIEPALEKTVATSWLAQSHFITAVA